MPLTPIPPGKQDEAHSVPCRVEHMRLLAPGVMGLWLRVAATSPFTWQAGQYVDVLLSGGRRRSFSLANPPHDAALLELHVKRGGSGGFTEQVFGPMAEGTPIDIEGPRGSLAYRPGSGPVLLVGGGTGYAPMKAILRHVLETGQQRRVVLFWGARTAGDLYEDAWLRALAAREPAFEYVPVLSEGTAGPGYRYGLLHEVVVASGEAFGRADVYAAGPREMVAALRAQLPGRGADPQRIIFDSH